MKPRLLLILALSACATHATATPPDIDQANRVARVGPSEGAWVNAIATYAWSEGALYQLYAAPGRVSDIALQPGEHLSGPNAVAAGDTARWVIGETESGAAGERQVHVLVKPIANGLVTNLLVVTDRRTYHLEMRATASSYMAQVSWSYPAGALVALRAAAPAASETSSTPAAALDFERLNFSYRILGEAPWKPVRVFDDGRRTAIDFPAGASELPPLYLSSPSGALELLNYRVLGRRMIVDRVFAAAELSMGDKKSQARVRLERLP